MQYARPHFDNPDTIQEMLSRIERIPVEVLPTQSPARNQLIIEATRGDMVDAWYNPQALDHWIIERITPGRRDSRWSPTEWIAYVQVGMPSTTCGACDDVPAIFQEIVGEDTIPVCFACHHDHQDTLNHTKRQFIYCSNCQQWRNPFVDFSGSTCPKCLTTYP